VRTRSQAEPPVGGPRATAATSDNAAAAGPLHGGGRGGEIAGVTSD